MTRLFFRKRSRLMSSNITLVFGDQLTNQRRREIMSASWKNLWEIGLEILRFTSKKDYFLRSVTIKNIEAIQTSLTKNRGVIIAGPHLGNYFLGAAALAQHFPVYVIIRPIKNRWLKAIYQRYLENMGFEIINRVGGLYRAYRALKKNAIVIFAMDQYAGAQGLNINFFGQPASTFSAPAYIALKQGTPVHIGYCLRKAENTMDVCLSDSIPLVQTGDMEIDLYENTLQFSNCIESIIKQHPESWLWMHRRWRVSHPAHHMD